MSIHKNYLLLSAAEKALVDDTFGDAWKLAFVRGVPLDGGDKAERAVEAFATFIIASRPKAPTLTVANTGTREVSAEGTRPLDAIFAAIASREETEDVPRVVTECEVCGTKGKLIIYTKRCAKCFARYGEAEFGGGNDGRDPSETDGPGYHNGREYFGSDA